MARLLGPLPPRIRPPGPDSATHALPHAALSGLGILGLGLANAAPPTPLWSWLRLRRVGWFVLTAVLAFATATASAQSVVFEWLFVRLTRAVGRGEADRLAERYGTEEAAALFGRYGAAEGEELVRLYGEGIARIAARHGEAGVAAVRAVGPRGVRFVAEHGEMGVRLLAHMGPAAFEAEARYGAAGLRILDELGGTSGRRFLAAFGADASQVYARLGPRGVAQALREPEFAAMWRAAARAGRGDEFLRLAERHGSRFLDFVRRNWKGVAVAALVTDFALHSDRYLATTGEVAARGVRDVAVAAGPYGLAAIAALFLAYRACVRRPGSRFQEQSRGEHQS